MANKHAYDLIFCRLIKDINNLSSYKPIILLESLVVKQVASVGVEAFNDTLGLMKL